MEVMKKENQKEIETAMVAVGVVILIAGVKHGLTTLVEQWRALAFLFLNLLLLTILFTSVYSNSTKTRMNKKKESGEKKNVKSKKMKGRCSRSTTTPIATTTATWPMQVEDLFKIEEETLVTAQEQENKDEVAGAVVAVEGDEDDDPQVSKEELNARVESFILMFRQQLALDAKERSTQVHHRQQLVR